MKKQKILDLLQLDLKIAKLKEEIARGEYVDSTIDTGLIQKAAAYEKAQGFTNGILTTIRTLEALKNWE